MNYLPYLLTAYAVFALILAWDWLSARRQLRQAWHRARGVRRRTRPRAPLSDSEDLQR